MEVFAINYKSTTNNGQNNSNNNGTTSNGQSNSNNSTNVTSQKLGNTVSLATWFALISSGILAVVFRKRKQQ